MVPSFANARDGIFAFVSMIIRTKYEFYNSADLKK